ncbi:MAG TPA: FHA domain-containing protein, partial [Polyangiaceae bacterium]|nr:FHA domain-containing protein [Polyangiaceae bacterium]
MTKSEPETLTRAHDGVSLTAQAIRVSVLDGPDAGQSVVVSPETPMRVHVGTAALSDLRLADREVSRRHFAIDCIGHRFRITDLDSTNGTRINGVPVEVAYVVAGDVVACGSTKLAIAGENIEQEALSSAMGFGRIVGASDAMRRLYPIYERLAASSVPVLIEGESGTG